MGTRNAGQRSRPGVGLASEVSGPAGGDLGGDYPDPRLAGLNLVVSITATTPVLNNLDPAGFQPANCLRVDPGGANRELTGLMAPDPDGQRLLALMNIGAKRITLSSEDSRSDPENRFLLSKGQSLRLEADGMVLLVYDVTSNRWRAAQP